MTYNLIKWVICNQLNSISKFPIYKFDQPSSILNDAQKLWNILIKNTLQIFLLVVLVIYKVCLKIT